MDNVLKEWFLMIGNWCFLHQKTRLSSAIHNMGLRYENLSKKELIELDDCLWEYIGELWKEKAFDELQKQADCLKALPDTNETVEWCANALFKLSAISDELIIEKDIQRKVFLWAKGFAEIYNKKSIDICEQLLEELPTSSGLTIEIRRALSDWLTYWYEGRDSREKSLLNNKALLSVVIDEKEKEELFECILIEADYDDGFVNEFLKREDAQRWWEIVFKNRFLNERNLIRLYEEVKPRCALPREVYAELFKAYLSLESFDKAREIIARFKENFNDTCAEEKYELELAMSEQRWEDALQLVDFRLKSDSDDSLFCYRGKILCEKGEHKESLESFSKCNNRDLKANYLQPRIIDYIMLNSEEKAIDCCKEYCELKGEEMFSFYLIHWVANCFMGESFLIHLLRDLDWKEFSMNAPSYTESPSQMVPHILRLTQKMTEEGRGIIRYKLLRVFVIIQRIKGILRVDTKEVKSVFHYSREESLRYLPEYSTGIGGNAFRLSNVAYLNDPEEGKTFDVLIKEGLEGEKNDDISDYSYRNAYLASFSNNGDSLPMWVQYSDDGKGCCYEIDTNAFSQYGDDYRGIIGDVFLGVNSQSQLFDRGLCLYKVFYYDKTKQSNDENQQEMTELCKALEALKTGLEGELQDKRIHFLLNGLLDSVRYLFKDFAYRTEKEMRVVAIDYFNEKKIDTSTDIPKFYLEYPRPFHYKKIILGPKAVDKKQKIAYLQNCRNVEAVELSAIHYV